MGLRDIAGDVGVDVALIGRYFGGKEGLFREVLHSDKAERFNVDLAPADLPAYFADLLVQSREEERSEHIERLLIMLLSSSSPTAARMVREAMHEDVIAPTARLLGGDDAPMRATLALATLMGSAILKTIMAVEPLCEEDKNPVRARLTRLFEAAMAEG